ncbi:ABC-2 family transporter protein [Seinonella peptonophila]|uniref:ABC-2 family transporter protein n=1 Tax=Seinonella peptonophila TaxID=112248 RepID=A0A1M4SSL5_9BACL|nr:ABC transporter permease [Seinonella peptonophila]SHE35244.1 ABC-2 family transporter protein [Seinonella peptonophila]
MLNVVYAEIIKLKNTKIYWLILIALIPVCLWSILAVLPKVGPNGTLVPFDLQELFYRQGMIVTILGPLLFSLITGYIVAREYQERTINQVFSYPVSRVSFLFIKLLVVLLLISITAVLSFVIVVSSMLLVIHQLDMTMLWLGLKMNLLICVLSFGTIPVAAAISMVWKSVIPTAVLGGCVSLIAVICELGHSMNVILFPWLTPYWPVRNLAQGLAEMGPNPYVIPALVILIITFVVSLSFCIFYYKRADVHSGT